ncbi:DUF2155 domain-containing protein [Asticcacaulis sp. EMRT-3]|uniref:DUF2155 domain-containing protein n=1 Tax=Asticcacaulis sp. EMRT-3 TaxID=3040349 RepID=UPI0024AF4EF7|nr:DUF2155 domain-containing protein [Asticcacaulis sp. EMRT-3]MDI7774554.1 DUF2155 domain-containing protein [Asticcacaulis sp. EMRT-3]
MPRHYRITGAFSQKLWWRAGLAVVALAVGCIVIPAGAQVAPPTRDSGDDSGNVPGYVDNADRQPYYVDGVEYKPYVPDQRRKKPDARQADNGVAPDAAIAPPGPVSELHPYVPTAPVNAPVVAKPATPVVAQASSVSSSSASPESYMPKKRPRYAVAVIEALDKVTAETVRFEAPIGKPIRYKGLIYTARACETTADDEAAPDVMAYLEVRTNPVAATNTTPAVRSREVFHGWSFASAPSLNPIEHPNYDAWVVACRQPLPGA